jgi:hypothetical protein
MSSLRKMLNISKIMKKYFLYENIKIRAHEKGRILSENLFEITKIRRSQQ